MDYRGKRKTLIDNYIKPRTDSEHIIEAFKEVPRHEFLPDKLQSRAYEDRALPIGEGQTISQPSLIAMMLDRLELKPDYTVLDLGTGSGYQAALLSRIVKHVVTIEIIAELSERARKTIKKLGYRNLDFIVGDGAKGFLPKAPYNAIIAAAAGKEVPGPLEEQLAIDGRIIIPLRKEDLSQQLLLGVKEAEDSINYRKLETVAFVPLVEPEDRQS